MSDFQVYLALSGEFDDPYTTLRGVVSIEQINKTSVLINGILTIDFANEILSIFPLQG